MTHHDDITAIRERFLYAWGNLSPVIIPGVDTAEGEPETAYCVLSVWPVDEERLTLSLDPDYESKGLVWIDIYSPLSDGDAVAWSLADRAATILRDWRSNDGRVRCETASFRNGADEGEFMRLIINVKYRARH
ncbi:DUF4128 domain-containing protein [Sphingomonas sp. H160509]|uniref:DUF4128 domain-containing protein n=1 Tax=Sphingomonas sp. H160509 TaxID=2955313 RepID=UPI002097FFF4|nr:DUF4128 domain-containing protein [Sphingomonas sp. H160509]MDD1452641.1 DUF4128 domain-containing protein [Sphingomonas sp. H160509]